MTNYEILSLVVGGFGATFVGISVLLLVKQLKQLSAQHADNHDWNRRLATTEALGKIRELDIGRLNKKFLLYDRRDAIPLDEINKAFEEQHELQGDIHRVMNFYEGLSNGIYLGLYDEDMIKANRKTAMKKTFNKFKYYVESRRELRHNDTLWCGYERLMNDWRDVEIKSYDKEQTGLNSNSKKS